jgi:hypothetical protein
MTYLDTRYSNRVLLPSRTSPMRMFGAQLYVVFTCVLPVHGAITECVANWVALDTPLEECTHGGSECWCLRCGKIAPARLIVHKTYFAACWRQVSLWKIPSLSWTSFYYSLRCGHARPERSAQCLTAPQIRTPRTLPRLLLCFDTSGRTSNYCMNVNRY